MMPRLPDPLLTLVALGYLVLVAYSAWLIWFGLQA